EDSSPESQGPFSEREGAEPLARPAFRPLEGDAVEVLTPGQPGFVPQVGRLAPLPKFHDHPQVIVKSSRGSWGLYLFFASTALLLLLTGLFFARRDLFEVAVQTAQHAAGFEAA